MKPTVTVGVLHPTQFESSYHLCWDRMRHFDWNRPSGGEPLIRHTLPCEANSGGITDSRNIVVAEFLDNTDDDFLLWLDADMGYAPDTIDRLILATGDDLERPIVGGLAFYQYVVTHGMNDLGAPVDGYAYAPTIFQLAAPGSYLTAPLLEYPKDALVECAATGSACVLIHRSVFEKMREEFTGPHHWYSRPVVDGREFGEDVTFCHRARNCGFPIFVDTSIKTSHKKFIYLTDETVPALSGGTVKAVEERSLNRAERRKRARASA